MSVSSIPESVKIRLWGKAGGRCEYDKCNEPLWIDPLTKVEFNAAYIAHIIADKPNGPRGDKVLSKKLKKEMSNLMLMCDKHHRLIDKEDVKGHTVERLQGMKKKHEDRIELLTSLLENKQSHVILYGANIGAHYANVSWEKATQAMLPNWYPAEKPAIELSLKNSSFKDNEEEYWKFEQEHLQRQFEQAVKPRLAHGSVNHFSVFGLAPQPLLIKFGRLLSDIPAAEIYQLHREPHPNWIWQDHPEGFSYKVLEPSTHGKTVALNLSLSATVNNSRITEILGDDTTIWTLTSAMTELNNDFLKSRDQLSLFRREMRILFDRIKARHGKGTILHVFPVAPVSVCIEIGRVWMPKVDLPMRIYDQNKEKGGFAYALDVI